MRIQTKLLLLLLLLVCLYLVEVAHERGAERQRRTLYLQQRREEVGTLFDRFVTLKGQPLEAFVNDYTDWDDLAKFASKVDPAWAQENLAPALTSFDLDAVWICRTNLTVVYSTNAVPGLPMDGPPGGLIAVERLLATSTNAHYFAIVPAGLLEVRGAAIHGNAGTASSGQPSGYLLAGHLWDAEHLADFALLPGARVKLLPPATGARDATKSDRTTGATRLDRVLHGPDGAPVQELQVVLDSASDRLLGELEDREFLFLIAFGCAVVGLLGAFLYWWISRPLSLIARALDSGDDAPLKPLLRVTDETGRLARLVTEAFAQREHLREEIAQRRTAEESLRASQQRLHEAIEDRVRLGRDLHDGIIQSIYAIGLGIEDCRTRLKQEPAQLDERLEKALTSLNALIKSVRGFILRSEPQGALGGDFENDLQQIIESFGEPWTSRIVSDIESAGGEKLTPSQASNLLLFAREALSNCVRHSQARTVEIAMQGHSDILRFQVRDDGIGFEQDETSRTGLGRSNMAARARELGAELIIDSKPGAGTTVILKLPISNIT
ncbi:MAG: ATP-binding protein [Verrucomicrobia bacterium]|nr:ATP-binding protein [Verrucomicrobiota bacterium]